jgi:hypothetical protein
MRRLANLIPPSRRHPTVGRKAHVTGHGVCTVFAFVEAHTEARFTNSFYAVIDAQGRSHYAAVGDVSLI